MKHAELLDCTLRDGAYLLDKQFGSNNITGIIEGLMDAQIDWIEIGFLQDNEFGEGKTVFRNSNDAKKYIPSIQGSTKFAVFADYSRYTIDNLDVYTGESFETVRACFFKHEKNDVISFCQQIKEKGYKLFVQPVDVLGYSDIELIELIYAVNKLMPDCFSIVDTFGSMYEDDLQRIFELIDHNLIVGCRVGFHSHNNLQMSSALSQAFIKMSFGRREVVVDATVSGMGRGAGNTPTELISQYLISKWDYSYGIDSILDVIDTYMDNIRTRCSWGYSTPFFIAGSYGAHVNNIDYLIQKNSIRGKDIRYILNQIGENRRRYNYELLESEYMEYLNSDIDDRAAIEYLRGILCGRNAVIIVPGKSVRVKAKLVKEYIKNNNAISILVNFIPAYIEADFLYMNNIKRYISQKTMLKSSGVMKILTSNIKKEDGNGELIISFNRLIKCGWEHMDNSTILLLRLLDQLGVSKIGIAGFDGYDFENNYANDNLEISIKNREVATLNQEISEMVKDFYATKREELSVEFITESRFDKVNTI